MDCYYSCLGDHVHALDGGFVDKSKVILRKDPFRPLLLSTQQTEEDKMYIYNLRKDYLRLSKKT